MADALKTKIDQFLAQDFSDHTRLMRNMALAAKVSIATLRDLADGQLSLRAMSLVYTTLITFVPLLAISFSVLKGFGVHNEIEPWLMNYLAPLGEKAEEVADRVIGFVDNIKVGVLGAVGFLLLIYSVIALMQKIEYAFNYIWRVNQSRSLVRRFSDYLSVLVFGPFLIFLSAGLTTTARSTGFFDYLERMSENAFAASIVGMGTVLIPYLVMAGGFCFFYIYMPNTKVRMKAAFIGGLFAALMWKIMGWIFAGVISVSSTYVAIYAAFATAIIFMVWVYLSWLVILIGANIAFYVQNPKYARFARADIVLSSRMRLATGLTIIEELVRKQYKEGAGIRPDDIMGKLNLPTMAVQNMFKALEDGGIIVTAESGRDDRYGLFYPARPLDQLALKDVVYALEHYAEKAGIEYKQMKEGKGTANLLKELDQAREDLMSRKVTALFDTGAK